MYVYMYVCMCMYVDYGEFDLCSWMRASPCVTHACMYVCVYVCMHMWNMTDVATALGYDVCMHVRIHACVKV
jgi:hypothetical protein